jgi:hypothetical protein
MAPATPMDVVVMLASLLSEGEGDEDDGVMMALLL